MSFSAKTPDQKPAGSESACMAWGGLAGALAGAVVGLFAGHWVVWAIFIGVVGLTAGALIDRSRR